MPPLRGRDPTREVHEPLVVLLPEVPAAPPHPPKWNSRSLRCTITHWALVPLSCDGYSTKALVKALGLLVAGSSENYCCVPTAYRARDVLAGTDDMPWQNRQGAARALNIAATVLGL